MGNSIGKIYQDMGISREELEARNGYQIYKDNRMKSDRRNKPISFEDWFTNYQTKIPIYYWNKKNYLNNNQIKKG